MERAAMKGNAMDIETITKIISAIQELEKFELPAGVEFLYNEAVDTVREKHYKYHIKFEYCPPFRIDSCIAQQ